MRSLILPTVLVCLAPATPAAADDLLDRLAAAPGPDEPVPCSHTLTVTNTQGEETSRLVYAFDARTKTTTLLEGPPEAFEREAARQADEAAGRSAEREKPDRERSVSFGPMSYAQAISTDLPWTRVGKADGLVEYRAAPLPKGTYEASGRDMSKRSEARLWVEDGETPRVRRHAYGLVKEFRVPMIARVRTLRQVTAYEAVGGAMRPSVFTVTFDADVMGDSQSGRSVMERSDWQCGGTAER